MSKIVFRVHAIQRIFKRQITPYDVERALANGKTTESYPNDQPYPSRLVFGRVAERPIHIVVADDLQSGQNIIVTVDEPILFDGMMISNGEDNEVRCMQEWQHKTGHRNGYSRAQRI